MVKKSKVSPIDPKSRKILRKIIRDQKAKLGELNKGDRPRVLETIAKLAAAEGLTLTEAQITKQMKVCGLRFYSRYKRNKVSTATTRPQRPKIGMPETLRVILTDESLNSKQRLALVETWFAA
jgi:hypothetical protein